jgi:hypothetical protein
MFCLELSEIRISFVNFALKYIIWNVQENRLELNGSHQFLGNTGDPRLTTPAFTPFLKVNKTPTVMSKLILYRLTTASDAESIGNTKRMRRSQRLR